MGFDIDSYLSAPIMDAKYDKVNIDEVISEHCQHLKPNQQRELHAVLSRYTKMFGGTLGLYQGKPMHIELEEGVQPVY